VTVLVRYIANPFDAGEVESYVQPWREGMTVDDALPARLTHRDLLTVTRMGQRLALQDRLNNADVLTVAAMPGEPITLALTSLYAAGFNAIGLTGLGAYAGAFVQATIAAIGFAILGNQATGGKRRGDELSPVYGFSGPGNIRVEGQPKPLIYGRFRYPGVVINEYTRTTTTPSETFVYTLRSFGYGPLHKISGLDADTDRDTPLQSGDAGFPEGFQVNGNGAENLDGITLAVRLGSLTQELLSGPDLAFDETTQRFTLALGLTSTETDGQDTSALAFDNTDYTTSAADDHFEEFGTAYDFVEHFDRFRILVTLPSGLYRITSGGTTEPTYLTVAIRYRELDNSGRPVTSGGPEGDGYVRLPLEERIAMTQREAFSFEIEHPFYDPQTFAHPTQGKALVLDGTNDYASVATPSVPAAWSAGTDIDSLSLCGWVRLDTANAEAPIFDWSDATRGVKFSIVTTLLASRIQVSIRTGAGWTDHTSTIQHVTTVEEQWVFVAMTYEKQSGSDRLLRIWFGNSLVLDILTSTTMVSPGGAVALNIGRLNTAGAHLDGRIDELEWINAKLTQADVRQRYSTGAGAYQTSTADHVGLWHFDVASATDSTPDDESTHANDLTLNNGASIPGTANGKVFDPTTGTADPKRGRFRLEVVRVNEESTHERVSDDAVWTEVQGILDLEFSYPSTPLAATVTKATDQLNTTIPTYTDLIEGRLVRVWDGLSTADPTFDTQWSRNPAWVALDLILDSRYGLGAWFASTHVDVQSFQDLADYADELIYDHHGSFEATGEWSDITYTGASGVGSLVIEFTAAAYAQLQWEVGDYVGFSGVPQVGANPEINNPAPSGWEITAMDGELFTVTVAVSLSADPWTSGTALSAHVTVDGAIEGREPRYCFDGAFDTERPAWDALLLVLSTARAIPIREGNRIRVKYERPRSPVDIVGQASIQADSFEVRYGGKQARANSLTLELLDEEQNFERVTVKLDHPSVASATDSSVVRTETLSLLGVCRRSQALRHGAWLLNVNDAIVRDGTFVANADTLSYEPGDVLVVSPDVLRRGGISGAVYATDADDEVQLDASVTLAASTTYELRVRNSADGLYETREVTSAAGSYPLGTPLVLASAFTFTPQRDDRYILSVQGSELLIQVQSISLQPNLDRLVEWVEYRDDTYADAWFGDIDSV
jgi:hypothetical protein